MADMKEEYVSWLLNNGVSKKEGAACYCVTLNKYGVWGDKHATAKKLIEINRKDEKSHRDTDQISHLKKYLKYLAWQKMQQAETLPDTNGIKWESCEAGETMYGSFVDARDGQQYACVKIGNQVWMVNSLRYQSGWAQESFWGNPKNGSGSMVLEDRYGVIGYSWATAMNMPSVMNKIALSMEDKIFLENDDNSPVDQGRDNPSLYQGIAPVGWKIPSKGDFYNMLDAAEQQGLDLHEIFRDCAEDEGSEGLHENMFWTINEFGSDGAYVANVSSDDVRIDAWEKTMYLPIRCVMDLK